MNNVILLSFTIITTYYYCNIHYNNNNKTHKDYIYVNITCAEALLRHRYLHEVFPPSNARSTAPRAKWREIIQFYFGIFMSLTCVINLIIHNNKTTTWSILVYKICNCFCFTISIYILLYSTTLSTFLHYVRTHGNKK